MKKDRSTSTLRLGLVLALLLVVPAGALRATEGGLGRPVTGQGIVPYAGLIPPAPGFVVSLGEIYYEGEFGASRPAAIAGRLALDLDAQFSLTPLTILYIWNLPSKQWTFASGATFSWAVVKATANVAVGPLTVRQSDRRSGPFDIAVTPLIACYHISKTDHFAFNFTFWAPTGAYDPSRLANVGLNNWTFIPSVAYTKIFPKEEIELSASWALQFYTENPDTDYQNAPVSVLELLAIKRFKSGFGIGVVGSWIQQLGNDTGPLADRLNGFVGRSFGVGPIAVFSKEIGKSNLSFSVRWVPEFGVKRRLDGQGFGISAGFKF